MIYTFYHAPCNDGELAAYVWQQKYPDSIMVPWDHTEKSNSINLINNLKNITIVFLDICPKIETLPIYNNYIIIDHHENAIKTAQNSPQLHKYKIEFHCDINKSGCMLTWDYCYNNVEYPLCVYHIGNMDIWNFNDSNTEPYCLGYNEYIQNNKMQDFNYFTEILCGIHNKYFISRGNEIILANKEKVKIYFNDIIFSLENDYEVIDIECPDNQLNKYLIEYAKENYNADVLRILHTKLSDKYVYSLRSLKDHINVDTIARKYGGNGHPKAAGYHVTLL